MNDHMGTEFGRPFGDVDYRISETVKEQGSDSTSYLADNGCNCYTTDSHCRTAKQTENHNRIKNNIQNSTKVPTPTAIIKN